MFKNIKIGTKIALGFGAITVLGIIVGITGYQIINNISHQAEVAETAYIIKENCLETQTQEKNYMMHKQERDFKAWAAAVQSIKTVAAKGQQVTHDADVQGWLRQGLKELERYEAFGHEFHRLIVGGKDVDKQLGNNLTAAARAVIKNADQILEKAASAMHKAGSGGKRIITVILGICVLLAIALAFVISRAIVKPIIRSADFAKKMSEGDFTQILDIDQKDEVGILAEAMNTMVVNLGKMFKDITAGVETLFSSSTELSAISQQMSSGSEQTSGKANTLATAAEEMSSNMGSVAAATEEASTNVSMVATASEEMTATINEIAQNTEKARGITGEAVSQAKSASDKVNELGTAAQEIGKVTEAISDISEQVNLLALNATIEAARAGEAGKGFAVVANEIKELAKQTAEATSEIKNKIGGIQSSTEGTVTEIEQISKVINDVNEMVSTIATAVEEQSVTTKEIANNVLQASQGIQEVTENVAQSSTVAGEIAKDISDVNQAANEMTNSSSQVNMSAEEMSKLAEQLKEMVGQFKV